MSNLILILLPFLSLGLFFLFKRDRKFYLFIDSTIQLVSIALAIIFLGISDEIYLKDDNGWFHLVLFTIVYIFLYQQFTAVCSWFWSKSSKKKEKEDYLDIPTFLFILCIAGVCMAILKPVTWPMIFLSFLPIKRVVGFVRIK